MPLIDKYYQATGLKMAKSTRREPEDIYLPNGKLWKKNKTRCFFANSNNISSQLLRS